MHPRFYKVTREGTFKNHEHSVVLHLSVSILVFFGFRISWAFGMFGFVVAILKKCRTCLPNTERIL